MIYGKIWLVVKPTVGVPLFLGAVAVGSFAVHYALLTNTTWVKQFLNGNNSKVAMVETGAASGAVAPPAAKK